ncbi:type II toxin-antitoxin system ChpB family toxin [Pseudomonas putida]
MSINLNPVVGREQQGELRPALVLSPASFNQRGLAFVAPITQGGEFARHAGFAVTLSGTGCDTQGVALVNQMRSVDLEARGARRVERVPVAVIDDALARVSAIFE